jgi:hypothetical protein
MTNQSHSFSVDLAEKYGVECAILINHFQFWIRQNQAMKRNFHDGRTWMYQSQKDIAAIYPYWSEDAVFRNIKKLIACGVLIKGNYNKTKFDQTAWYAFANENIFTKPRNDGISPAKSQNQHREIAQPIPDTKPDIKQEQQQAAPDCIAPKGAVVAPFKSKKSKYPTLPIWPILEPIDIPIDQKQEITMDYSEKDVIHGVKYSTHPLTKIKTSLVQTIKWACKMKPDLPVEKVDRSAMNKAYAKRYDGIISKSGNSRIDALPECVTIVSGPHSNFSVAYEDKNFMEKFTDGLMKHKYMVMEA